MKSIKDLSIIIEVFTLCFLCCFEHLKQVVCRVVELILCEYIAPTTAVEISRASS